MNCCPIHQNSEKKSHENNPKTKFPSLDGASASEAEDEEPPLRLPCPDSQQQSLKTKSRQWDLMTPQTHFHLRPHEQTASLLPGLAPPSAAWPRAAVCCHPAWPRAAVRRPRLASRRCANSPAGSGRCRAAAIAPRPRRRPGGA